MYKYLLDKKAYEMHQDLFYKDWVGRWKAGEYGMQGREGQVERLMLLLECKQDKHSLEGGGLKERWL